MRRVDILNKRESRAISDILTEQWGTGLPEGYALLRAGRDRLSLVRPEALDLDDKLLRIDSIGLYFATMENHELRPSIEGSQLIGLKATKGIIDLDDSTVRAWLRGDDIATDEPDSGFLLVRHGSDFFGAGKVKNKRLLNFYPKSRRITTSSGNNT